MKITEQARQYMAKSPVEPGRGASRAACAPDSEMQRGETPEVICEIRMGAERMERTNEHVHPLAEGEAAPLQERIENSTEHIVSGFEHDEPLPDSPRIDTGQKQSGLDTIFRDIAVLIGHRANTAVSGALAGAASEMQSGPITVAVRAVFSDIAGQGAGLMLPQGQDIGGSIAESIRHSLADIMKRARALVNRTSAGYGQSVQEADPKDDGYVRVSEGSGPSGVQRAFDAAAALQLSLAQQYANRLQNDRIMSAEIVHMSPDSAASSILRKARLGGRIEPSDLSYVSRTRPDQMGLLSKTTAERDALTRRMRNARSKSEVRMVHLGAVVTAGKTSISTGEADTRINQLNDAKYEYVKTAEYRRKPELPPKSLKRRPGEGQGYLRTSLKTCGKAMHKTINIGRTFN